MDALRERTARPEDRESRCALAVIPTAEAIEAAFAQAQSDHVDGVIVNGSMFFNERARVGTSALAHGMPTISFISEMVPYGLLMSYGQDFPDYFRKAAAYADKILRGAKPADLPVEQPTRFKQGDQPKSCQNSGVDYSFILAGHRR